MKVLGVGGIFGGLRFSGGFRVYLVGVRSCKGGFKVRVLGNGYSGFLGVGLVLFGLGLV